MLSLPKLSKKIIVASVILLGFIAGCLTAYGIETVNGNSSQRTLTSRVTVTPSLVPSPRVTMSPSSIVSPTVTIAPTSIPTPIPPTPTMIATPTPLQLVQAQVQTSEEQLSLQMFEPSFLWADYLDVGLTEAIVIGTGFTPQTKVELFPSRLDPTDPLPNEGSVYPLESVTFNSSQELKGKLPAGLANSYYGIRVKNPDGKQVEKSNVVVVSGSTHEAGSASLKF